jgi:2,3-bisphosphoglycerate-dependent phosphoglycerate mutase
MAGPSDSSEPTAGQNVLVLVRHGESEWNKLNRFTGWKDVGLTEEGMAEAHRAGTMLKELNQRFDCAFTSTLKRAHNPLDISLEQLGQGKLPTLKAALWARGRSPGLYSMQDVLGLGQDRHEA